MFQAARLGVAGVTDPKDQDDDEEQQQQEVRQFGELRNPGDDVEVEGDQGLHDLPRPFMSE